MKSLSFETLKSLLKSPKNVVIIPHVNPDGDAIGSSLGLYHYLIQKRHSATIVVPNDYPAFLKWLPGTSEVLNFEFDSALVQNVFDNADLVFTLDFNALHRCGNLKSVLEANTAPKIMIDHHQHPEAYAAYTYSDTEMGSTAEMIYHFMAQLGDLELLNKDIGTALYTGIMTDTASFRFPKTTATTHRVVAHLIEVGIAHSEIHSLVYDANRFERIQLVGIALSNLRVLKPFNAAYITLSQDELDACNYQKGDTEGLVNYGLSVKGVKLAAIFIENSADEIIKISLRSKGAIDVNQIAREHFNGGGHVNAAGGKSDLSLAATVDLFKALVVNLNSDLE